MYVAMAHSASPEAQRVASSHATCRCTGLARSSLYILLGSLSSKPTTTSCPRLRSTSTASWAEMRPVKHSGLQKAASSCRMPKYPRALLSRMISNTRALRSTDARTVHMPPRRPLWARSIVESTELVPRALAMCAPPTSPSPRWVRVRVLRLGLLERPSASALPPSRPAMFQEKSTSSRQMFSCSSSPIPSVPRSVAPTRLRRRVLTRRSNLRERQSTSTPRSPRGLPLRSTEVRLVVDCSERPKRLAKASHTRGPRELLLRSTEVRFLASSIAIRRDIASESLSLPPDTRRYCRCAFLSWTRQ
mmetsp:Transcript_9948/g.32245  ORF Transcript_9948/g.32245 Transcript_9948/m.32245 type:complete len:304 (+) Transcript_9948:968-1879(+)